jgi:outer membrane biosynthesis protein TonB
VFLYLLLTADYKDEKKDGIELQSGQVLITERKMMKELNLSRRIIRTCLQKLNNGGEIKIKANHRFSLITILKFDSYQQPSKKNEPVANHKTTQSKQPANQELMSVSRSLENQNEPQNDPLSKERKIEKEKEKESNKEKDKEKDKKKELTTQEREEEKEKLTLSLTLTEVTYTDNTGSPQKTYVFDKTKRLKELQTYKLSSLRNVRAVLTDLAKEHPESATEYDKEIDLIDELIAKKISEVKNAG